MDPGLRKVKPGAVASTTTLTGSPSITIPDHDAIRIGTLNSILADVALAQGLEKSDLVDRLSGP
jgi:hypothetical protein